MRDFWRVTLLHLKEKRPCSCLSDIWWLMAHDDRPADLAQHLFDHSLQRVERSLLQQVQTIRVPLIRRFHGTATRRSILSENRNYTLYSCFKTKISYPQFWNSRIWIHDFYKKYFKNIIHEMRIWILKMLVPVILKKIRKDFIELYIMGYCTNGKIFLNNHFFGL